MLGLSQFRNPKGGAWLTEIKPKKGFKKYTKVSRLPDLFSIFNEEDIAAEYGGEI